MANQSVSEELFQAMDVIFAKRLSELHYDQTLICTIKNTDNAKNGEYIVSDTSTSFTAYSDNTDYLLGTQVYVTVPNGDMNNQKMIIGRYVSEDGSSFKYTSPLNDFVNVTDNIVNENVSTSLLANKDWWLLDSDLQTKNEDTALEKELKSSTAREKTLWSWNPSSDQGLHDFNRLGISAKFKTSLRNLAPKAGTFGLRIIIQVETVSTLSSAPSLSTYALDFSNDDFFGNRFCFDSYFQQEKLFDLSDILVNSDTSTSTSTSTIKSLQLVAYQDANFVNKNNEKIPFLDENNLALLPDNIWIKDINISFGYSLEDYPDGKLILGSRDGQTFSPTKADNNKEVYLRWVIKLEEGNFIVVDTTDEFEELYPQGKIHWYKNYMADDVSDDLAGAFWVELLTQKEIKASYSDWKNIASSLKELFESGLLTEEEYLNKLKTERAKYDFYQLGYNCLGQDNTFKYMLNPETGAQTESVKVIIETITSAEIGKSLETNSDLTDYLDRFKSYGSSNGEEIKNYTKIEYPVGNRDWDIEDKYDCFVEDIYNALANASEDKFSQIYEAYSKGTVINNKSYKNILTLDEATDIMVEPEWPGRDNTSKLQQYEEELAMYNSYLERKQNVEDYFALKEVVLTAHTERTIIESDILKFENETQCPNYAGIDLIRGLQIECDPEEDGGCGGVYFLYGSNNEILNSAEARKTRPLRAKYTSLVTGDMELDKASQIQWFIPLNNTMIQAPEAGTEYCLNTAYDRAYDKWKAYEEDSDRSAAEIQAAKVAVRNALDNFQVTEPTFAYDIDTLTPRANKDRSLLDKYIDIYEEKNGFAIITRLGSENYFVAEDAQAGDSQQIDTEQLFRIKDFYNASATNNIVYCKIIKNNVEYQASVSLAFGVEGSNGSNATFQLILDQWDEEINSYIPINAIAYKHNPGSTITAHVTPRLYDYNHKEVDLTGKTISYEWYSGVSKKSTVVAQANKAYKEAFDRNEKVKRDFNSLSAIEQEDPEKIAIRDEALNALEAADTAREEAAKVTGFFIDKENVAEDQIGVNININIDEDQDFNCEYFCHSILQATIRGFEVLSDWVSQYDDNGNEKLDEDGNPVLVQTSKTVDLVAYLPIPVYFTDNADVSYQSLPSSIIYTTDGNNPSYYKNHFQLFNKYNLEIEDVQWVGSIQEATENNQTTYFSQYYPSLKHDKDDESKTLISPQAMYFKECTGMGYGYSIIGIKSEVTEDGAASRSPIFVQPILIIQNRYNSSMLNNWDGSLTINKKNGTILSTMMGAGIKNTDNSFSGILLGDVENTAGLNEGIGLYGYDHGASSFGFKVDGTAFLGAPGKGRIYFDGNTGIIKSGNYSKDYNTGMLIDMNSGLDGSETEGSSFAMYGLGDTGSYQGVEMDTTSGTIFKLYVQDANSNIVSDTKSLIEIGSNNYFLQTANFDTAAEQGLKIDLKNGRLTGYDFEMRAGANNQYLTINSRAEEYPFNVNNKFKINWNGSVSISNGAFQILESGSIEIGNKFKVFEDGAIAIDSSLIKYDGTSDKFNIYTNASGEKTTAFDTEVKPKFYVTNDGSLYAQSGYFGGEIEGGALLAGDMTINGSFYVRGYSLEFDEENKKYTLAYENEDTKEYKCLPNQIVGYIGYAQGAAFTGELDDFGKPKTTPTYGIRMSNADSSRELVITNAGIRLSVHNSYLYLDKASAAFTFKDPDTNEEYEYNYSESSLSNRETYSVRINGNNIVHKGNIIDYIPGVLAIFA